MVKIQLTVNCRIENFSCLKFLTKLENSMFSLKYFSGEIKIAMKILPPNQKFQQFYQALFFE